MFPPGTFEEKRVKAPIAAGSLVMSTESRQKFIWGWLRFALGIAQISLVFASVGLLLLVGLHPLTLISVVSATLLTIVSRVLYRGQKGPKA